MEPMMQRVAKRLSHDKPALLAQWLGVIASEWRTTPDRELRVHLAPYCRQFLDEFALALATTNEMSLGDIAYREPVKVLAFASGSLPGAGYPVSVGLALGNGLSQVTGGLPQRFLDGLLTTICESYCTGLREQAVERHRSVIRRSQVVCLLRPKMVGLFLVGDPDTEALEDAIGRMMMLAVMRDVSALVIDVSGAIEPEHVLAQALAMLCGHDEALGQRRVMLTGALLSILEQATTDSEREISCREELDQGIAALSLRVG